jgi:acyl-CoA thioesterase-1
LLRRRNIWLAVVLVLAIGTAVAYLGAASGGTNDSTKLTANRDGTIQRHVHLRRPIAGPLRILFVGDSLTVGDYATRGDHAFPALVSAALRRRGIVTELLRAKVGVKASYWATRPLPTADLVVLELGTNDFSKNLTPPRTFDRDYQRLVAHLRATSPRAILLCLSIWRSARHAYRYHDEHIATYNSTIANDCHDGAYVPISQLFDRRANRTPAARTALPGAPDGFHPNNRGHHAIAAAILAALR